MDRLRAAGYLKVALVGLEAEARPVTALADIARGARTPGTGSRAVRRCVWTAARPRLLRGATAGMRRLGARTAAGGAGGGAGGGDDRAGAGVGGARGRRGRDRAETFDAPEIAAAPPEQLVPPPPDAGAGAGSRQPSAAAPERARRSRSRRRGRRAAVDRAPPAPPAEVAVVRPMARPEA